MFHNKREIFFTILATFFVTNAIIGELIGGKLIQLSIFTLSIGILPWPVVFVTTDIINEYFGKKGVRKLTFIAIGLIIYTFIILALGLSVPAASFSPVDNETFSKVFGQSQWIIVGSITAFLASQLVDVFAFWVIKKRTGHKMIWLRATGSTVISQLIDTFIIGAIAFWLPGKLSFEEYLSTAVTSYFAKLIIAIALTPLIYLFHYLAGQYLGEEEASKLAEQSTLDSI
ncbi:MAG: queuosine precursor transporter [Deltaproteobacteria bacterium]|nr:queuosine precursor transporter [Deltaproteobacteria bacterium]